MNENTTVLISGAGIAGLTLAYWLRRHGFAPTVVERAPAIRAGGYKVDIRGAALTVAERMGLMDEIRARRTGVRSGTVVNAAGRRVASMDGDTFGGRVHGDAELLRGDLHQLLFDNTEAEYLFGDSITGLTQTDAGVEVVFDSGLVRTFDLVVGADGLHSATRALAFGPEEEFLRDLGHRIAIFGVPNHLDLDREEVTFIGPGRTALVYSTGDGADAKAMFLFRSGESGGTAVPRGREAQEKALAAAYEGEGWEVPRLLDAMPAAQDFYFDAVAQVRMDRWSSGRVALLGDAAYCASPASGQGTSLAMVGAYVLAGELAAADGDHRAAFAAYEREMQPFVERNQKLGPSNLKRMVMRTPGAVRMSMAMLGLMNRMPGRERMMAKVIAPIHAAATAIALKEY
ncbi:FAD-dependent monooxygenase [Actinomadura verrucosospora]|uniref:FAD-binding monooxygenase protein n=1 Tax=Actinomadura verrucosospora TaxID=46165 RepID=A0A7D4AQP2_ACTVE|nr:FAD-dependent monooxygenase [Actinomadura verrucosospora]QKG22649.1 FAD-binding monooxygenase protein [Actinomadura verrucosospora]